MAVVVLSAFVVLGCSGSENGQSSAGTAEPTTDTAATIAEAPDSQSEDVTGPLSAEEAAALYLELVRPTNCAIDGFNSALEPFEEAWDPFESSDALWPRIQAGLQPLANEVADAQVRFYEGLLAATWPDDVQSDIDALVGQLSTEAQGWRGLAQAESADNFFRVFVELGDGENIAGIVRAKLGLPPNFDEAGPCAGLT